MSDSSSPNVESPITDSEDNVSIDTVVREATVEDTDKTTSEEEIEFTEKQIERVVAPRFKLSPTQISRIHSVLLNCGDTQQAKNALVQLVDIIES